ncbi:MAG: Glycosyl transferase, family 2 [Actinobacteria bacterium]|nr:Glycosyl transferase, family 2 [Actinomycetota bacterium]
MIIPALDEETSLPATIRSAREAGADEVVVVDGGSADGSRETALRLADTLVCTARGRAAQMNAGARASSGEALLFLHADTLLPPESIRAVRAALRRADIQGGAFSVRLEVSPSASPYMKAMLRLTGRMICVRSRLFRSYTFEALEGYPEVQLMEDVEFSRRMTRRGKTLLLPVRITTSGRRWEAAGAVRTILLMWSLRAGHFFGLSPSRCAEFYGRGRGK